jgi:hypothetical protein
MSYPRRSSVLLVATVGYSKGCMRKSEASVESVVGRRRLDQIGFRLIAFGSIHSVGLIVFILVFVAKFWGRNVRVCGKPCGSAIMIHTVGPTGTVVRLFPRRHAWQYRAGWTDGRKVKDSK